MNDQFKHLIAIYAIKNIMKIITTVKPVENGHLRSKRFFRSSGLQIKGGGLFDREFTKSLIIRDFDDPYKFRFLSNQFYKSETLETWSVSRNR